MRLEQLQHWMAGMIMRPLPEDFRMARGDDRLSQEIERVIAPSDKLGSMERLEIYNRQYWFRLLDSLSEDFPALVRLVGNRAFRGLAESYLRQYPSRSFTLRDLGSRLSSWLESLAKQDMRQPESWCAGLRYPLQFLADVAALEWAYIEAFDAAEFPPLRADEFGNGAIDLRLQPFVRPLALRFHVSPFVAAIHNGQDDAPAVSTQPQTNYAAVYRQNFLPVSEPVLPSAFPVLAALSRGDSLQVAVEQALSDGGVDAVEASAEIQKCFTRWTSLGWLLSAIQVR